MHQIQDPWQLLSDEPQTQPCSFVYFDPVTGSQNKPWFFETDSFISDHPSEQEARKFQIEYIPQTLMAEQEQEHPW